MVTVRPPAPGLEISSAVAYSPCANDAPRRNPVNGVTPAPATNTGVWRGLVGEPTSYARVGAELTTAARASQRFVETVNCAPSGYVADTADTRGPAGSNAGIGTT